MRAVNSPRLLTVLVMLVLLVMLTSGVSCKKKTIVNPRASMSAEDVYEQGLEEIEQGKLLNAIQSLSLIDLRYDAGDRQRLEPLVKLAMADATFYQSNDIAWIDARSLYLDFVTFYGDHPMAPYAQFQAGVCSLNQVRQPTRDQTQTFQALEDLDQVSRRYPASPFAKAARDMIAVANTNLAEHEFLVGRFYKKRKRYIAAAERFRRVLDGYPRYPERDKVLFYIGETLQRSGALEEAQLYWGQLLNDYPDSKYLKQTRRAVARTGQEIDDLSRGGP